MAGMIAATATEDHSASWEASQYNHSSTMPNPTGKASSQLNKVYKQAYTLYLTRRLPEALSTLEPVVAPSKVQDVYASACNVADTSLLVAVSRNVRVKILSLYITLLNDIVALGPEEGKSAFGSKEWRALVTKCKDGSIWEEVVRNGYGSNEGAVDADVVANLAMLLLANSTSQDITQQRLERWLLTSDAPALDMPSQLNGSVSGAPLNGANTPKELDSRIKVIELYSLHVLPRNHQWDLAREFIEMNQLLDEENKEIFLRALKDLEAAQEQQLQQKKNEKKEEEEKAKQKVDVQTVAEASHAVKKPDGRRASTSPGDYGIEGSTSDRKAKSVTGDARRRRRSRPLKKVSPPSTPRASKRETDDTASQGVLHRTTLVLLAVQQLISRIAHSLSSNPTVFLRAVLFLMGIALAFSRRDIKEMVKMAMSKAWKRVRETVGMGVKVSYI